MAVSEPMATRNEDDLQPGRRDRDDTGLQRHGRARPIDVETMTALRLSRRSTFGRVWMPTAATFANIARDAPPMTGCGAPTMAAALGEDDHEDTRCGHDPAGLRR